ncbi:MAG: hypothetical protein MJ172_01730 [Clostridia bacterium]|nr:hypothetical protein [Clostridia bacterium]
MISIIVASAFLLIAISILIYLLCFYKPDAKYKSFKKYYIALELVYLSAILLIWVLSLINHSLPAVFVIVAGITVSSVFLFSAITIRQLTVNMEAIRVELLSKKQDQGNSNEP